jgi:hypothetical protein
LNSSTETTLLWTAGLVGAELALFAVLLFRRGLFHWLSAGFWAWAAFGLYYVAAPLAAVMSGNLARYQIRLEYSGGAGRGWWILAVILTGIAIFFLAYLRTVYRIVTLGMIGKSTPALPFFPPWLLLFAGFGLYALLASRAGLTSWGGERLIVSGRFVGDITGYQNVGYMFLIYPILLLLSWPKRGARALGGLLFLVFMFLSLPHAWSRFATISILLAGSMIFVAKQRNRWPSLPIAITIILAAFLYQARGHVTWRYDEIPERLSQTWRDALDDGIRGLSESDTEMLATLWLKSYLHDTWIGYDFSLPLINYTLTGWIPGKIFPEKYFIIDWLRSIRSGFYPAEIGQLLRGAKASMIGDFYGNGGLIAVVLEMAIAGWLSRRLDGMLDDRTTITVRALGIAWLSFLWMVWGSGSAWALIILGATSIPAIALILLVRLFPEYRVIQTSLGVYPPRRVHRSN